MPPRPVHFILTEGRKKRAIDFAGEKDLVMRILRIIPYCSSDLPAREAYTVRER